MGAKSSPIAGLLAMFRWPDRLVTVLLAYGLVFVGVPALCWLSYLWVTGRL